MPEPGRVTTDSRERPEWAARDFGGDLDPGIAAVVHLLMDHEIETFESCQGGPGHHGGAGEWPVVRFYGQQSEGFKGLSVALMYGLPVHALNRVWRIQDGEPTGPQWELVFYPSMVGSAMKGEDESVSDMAVLRGRAETAELYVDRLVTSLGNISTVVNELVSRMVIKPAPEEDTVDLGVQGQQVEKHEQTEQHEQEAHDQREAAV